jgi:serine/threonine protein kinase/Tol biopolymer transport system component
LPIASGQILGRYRIEEQIGAGGMGIVYRAYDEKLERELAIKVLPPGMLLDAPARKRFRNEARILSRLNHPAIQTIHDFDTIDGYDLLISELVPGVSLDTRLLSGRLPEKEVLRIGQQLAQGLGAAHAEGVLHRDLKPANLTTTPDGRLKILDFGLATLTNEAALSISKTTQSMTDLSSSVAGTLPYMSPEQLLGEDVDERSDLYSAGVVLFELLTAQLPFKATLVAKLTNAILNAAPPSPAQYLPRVSPEMERIVLKCLEKDPGLRYQSAKELVADLRRMEAVSERLIVSTEKPKQRPRWIYATVIAGALGLTIVTAYFLLPWLRDRRDALTGPPVLRWEQLTNFNDSAQIPAVSPDGKIAVFLRGPGDFGSSVTGGQLWSKALPDGDPVLLTRTPQRKQTLAFSLDGTRVFFTQVEGPFAWNTYEIPLLGAGNPKLFRANATGLTWVANDRVMYSAIKQGIHMALLTSNLSRTDERDIYVPADQMQGMVHRSALSPDGKWVLAVEMDGGWWKQCRLIPFNGSSTGTSVGPNGSCTWAQWSPDGKWMYFTVKTGSSGSHIWRQRFPDGLPQQLTPTGASEEEGLAVMPDGRSLITAAGAEQSEIWLHQEKTGERQITQEGYALLPSLSPDGKKVYYLRKASGSPSYFSGELWASDVETGGTEHLFPGLFITHFCISPNGNKIVFATEQGQGRSGIWIADLDRTQPPRQLTSAGENRAFFGRQGEIVYQGTQDPVRVMRMNEDGTGQRPVSDMPIMQLGSVSPDGRWAVVGVNPQGGHGDRNVVALAMPLDGGKSFTVCETCTFGFGAARIGAPLVLWSRDGKWLYITLRYFGYSTGKTAVIPTEPGAPPWAIKDMKDEAAVLRTPGVRVIAAEDVFPLNSPDYYVSARKSAKTNLFRIYLGP